MRSVIASTLMGLVCSLTAFSAQVGAVEVPKEFGTNLNLPSKFAIKGLYKSDNSVIFREGEIVFAVGRFNKKYSLKTPYGYEISSARLYELVPNNRPLLVIRDHDAHVLGYVQLENYRKTQIFKPVTGIIYDKNGTNILKSKFPLASKYCKIWAVEQNVHYAATRKGKDGDFDAVFSEEAQHLGFDPLLVLSILHIHSSKSLLTGLARYVGIDEINIDDLGSYALISDNEKEIKELTMKASNVNVEEENQLLCMKELLMAAGVSMNINDEDKETLASALAHKFGEETSVEELTAAIPSLTEDERAVLLEMVDSRL